ncbi:kinase-like domain-containing protein [Massariosphaeria phaeospora]|uniref:Kinase-like domain-containing protein n=1 Tax=Massariosphaeria phaeospora TaxID=100035 RepID=A0A7C8M2M3_9PLEO|nr:kinase-like domain-containing protein [Massariosphaeria phaeospora]
MSTRIAVASAVGRSGRRYLVERILQDRSGPLGRVYLASSAAGSSQRYVLKSVSKIDFTYLDDMFADLRDSPYIRVADDAIPDRSMFAYKYLRDHLLSFGIVHTDIKANNIMVDWEETDGNVHIQRVQIADLEDAAYVPDDEVVFRRQVGNWMWRSPEAHASSKVQKLSDIFSFGVVCVYAITKRVIFAVDDEELKEGEEKLAIVLERQLSYFSQDMDSVVGLIQYLGDNPWAKIFTVITEGFNKEFPRKPFELWRGLEPDFKDLVGKMTNVDPERRITA